jgi:hypothetical protein
MSVPFSRVPSSSFRGCGAPAVRERVAQCHGVDTDLTAQRRTVAGMAAQGRRSAEQRRDMIPRRCQRAAWRGFAFDPGIRSVSEHSMLWSGEWARRHGPVAADPREPRARRSPARGRAQPSSEAEFRPRGAGAGCLLGRWRYPGRGCMRCNLSLVSSFMFLLFCEKSRFSPGYQGTFRAVPDTGSPLSRPSPCPS